MNDLIIKDNIKIENLIYEIRGKQVMLDSDLAMLYNCKNGTKEINQAVKNNIDKFPKRFSWKLSDEESNNLLVKNFDQKIETRGGRYKNPRVFTEQGVAMLATIIKSKVATEVSIKIMDAFVEMRRYITSNNHEKRLSNIETKIIDYDNKFEIIFDKLESKVNNHLFFKGQIYDAYSLLLDIFDKAEKEIIIIDNYASKKLLDVICKTKKSVIVVSSNMDSNLISMYKKQYDNLDIINCNSFHDRFIILDRKILYHCGSSFKDLGIKCFAINEMNDDKYLSAILNIIF